MRNIKTIFRLLLGVAVTLAFAMAICPIAALGMTRSLENVIVEADGQVTISSVDENSDEYGGLVESAKEYGCGFGEVEPGQQEASFFGADGKILKAFTIEGNDKKVNVSIPKPNVEEWVDEGLKNVVRLLGIKPSYRLVVSSADSNGPTWLYILQPTNDGEDRLSVEIPLLDGKVICGVTPFVSVTEGEDMSLVMMPDNPLTNVSTTTFGDTFLENSEGVQLDYAWSFALNEDMASMVVRDDATMTNLTFDVIVDCGEDFEILPENVSVESSAVKFTSVNKQDDGTWVIRFVANSFDTKAAFKEAVESTTSIKFRMSQINHGGDVEDVLPVVCLHIFNDAYEVSPINVYVMSNPVVASKQSAVTVTPADMTVYEDGEDGYEGVVGVDGVIVEGGSDSLPHPLFEISAPKGTSIDPKSLTFSTGSGENAKSWSVESAGGNLYYFVPADNQDPVRVTYTGEDGTPVLTDNFTPSTDLYATYRIDLYPGENNLSEVTASTGEEDAQSYPISVNSGTLTVRAVANDNPNNVTFPVGDEPTDKLQAGTASVSAPEGTTYKLNNTDVSVPENGSAISLLFDDIINGDAGRTSALLAKVDANADTSQAKYLDLVDANNGNAWVTASGSVTVHWAYPEGTDKNTEFKLWHFPGLHRDDSDGDNSGFDIDDLNNVEPEEVTPLIKGNNALSFSVASGCFSPYVLTWEEKEEPDTPIVVPTKYHTITATAGEGGSISPSGEVKVTEGGSKSFSISADEGYTVGNVTIDGVSYGPLSSYTFSNVQKDHTISVSFMPGSDPANPDDTGVSDWLSTDEHLDYLHGYGDGSGTFGPENQMTRAEVAQMFYNLLLDKSRGDKPVSFTDVPADAYYAEPVFTLASLGIVNGTSPETFEPNRPITRAEFVAIAMRFTNGEFEGENLFVDVPEDAWYRDYVVGAVGYGWIVGYQDGSHRFGPEDTITRSQATMVTNRMLWRVPDGVWINDNLDDLKLFPDVGRDHFAFRDIVEATNAHDYERNGHYESWTGLVK